MYITKYQAVYEWPHDKFWRIPNAIGRSKAEAVQLASSHAAVKAGAVLSYWDEWEVWED
jgi:hypothetical protein